MKKTTLYILMSLGFAFMAQAQEPTLTKEITVETDFVPVEQKVNKLNTLPAVAKTEVPKKTLSYSNWSGAVDIPAVINKFEAYGYNTKYPFSTTKGYFDLGAGSQLNVVGSAGYKLVDKEAMTLNAWLQHTSTWAGKNSSVLAGEDPLKQKNNDNVLSLNLSNRFDTGLLDLGAYYHFDNFNYYGVNEYMVYADADKQTVNEFGVRAGWSNPVKGDNHLQFSAQLAFNHFGYSKNLNNAKNGLQENNVHANVFSEAIFGDFSLGIDAGFDYLGYSNMTSDSGVADESDWIGMLKASPYIRYNTGNLQLIGGVNVDLSLQDGSKVRLSPKIKADYKVFDGISVYANAGGGKRLNRLSDFHSICRYLAPSEVLGSSFSPVNAEFGVNIGPFGGFYFKPFFAYGSFKDEITPVASEWISPYVFTQKYDIKGWKAGAEVGYKYNDLLDFNACVQYAPQDDDEGYMTGLDRAEMVVNAQMKITPIKPLSITVGYELRNGRAYYSRYEMAGPPPVISWKKTELDDVNNLSLEAYYQVNKTVGVFVHASNLLNSEWDDFVGMGAQKINALAGVNILF